MTRCSVPDCHNSGGHLFPKDLKLKKKWMAFAQKKEVGRYAIICKAHFKDSDFFQLAAVEGLPTPRKRLRPDAVPSLIMGGYCPPKPFRPPRKRGFGLGLVKPAPTVEPCVEKITIPKVRCKAPVISDTHMVSIIEVIKDKLMKNAPNSAQFPRRWLQPGPVVNKKKVRDGYPPFSMACLVAMAIESTVDQRASTSYILSFISQNFPCYKLSNIEWQNSVVRTIQLYKLFNKLTTKDSPNPDEMYWMFCPNKKTVLSPEVYEAFTNPRYDESKIDFHHAVIQTDFEIVSVSPEDIEETSIVDMNADLQLPTPEEEQASFSAMDETGGLSEKEEDLSEEDGLSEEDDFDLSLSPSESEDSVESEQASDSNIEEPDDDQLQTLYKCSFCKFTSKSDKLTSKHLLENHWNGKLYCCKDCDFVTPESEILKSHKLKSHKVKR